MSQITIQATKTPVIVSATGGSVSATVTGSTVSASTTGGIGPQGIQGVQGPQGIPGDAIAVASDVQLVGLADGDLLAYSATEEVWTNADTLDGGNW